MKIYDTRIPIHETPEGVASIHSIVEKLSDMLDEYGVDHCVTLPGPKDMEADDKLTYCLFYQSEQNTELTLVIALWARIYRKKTQQQILESIVKSFGIPAPEMKEAK